MADTLGAAELLLTVDDKGFKDRLDAALAQVGELQKATDLAGTSLSKAFGREYRVKVNDSQVQGLIDRLVTVQRQLKEVTAEPYNVRLNFVQSGLGTGAGGQLNVKGIQQQIQQILQGGLSGQVSDVLRGGAGAVGAARTEELRKSLLARLERGSLGASGFNLPGLREIITQLGKVPIQTGKRAPLLDQARKTIQGANDAVINRIGQDLLDLQLSLSGAPPPPPGPPGGPRRRGQGRQPSAESVGNTILSQELAINELEAKGVEVAELRAQLNRQRNALQSAELNQARALGNELERQLKIEKSSLTVANTRQRITPTGSVSVTKREQIIDKFTKAENRINILEAKGVEVTQFRNRLQQAQNALAEANLGTVDRITRQLNRALSVDENRLRVASLRAKQAREEAAAAEKAAKAGGAIPGLPKPPLPPPLPQPQGPGRFTATLARLSSQEAISSALIGGGFPALFGQGLGASIGGALGGLGGGALGGGFGFGLSIIGTLVGSQFDIVIEKSKALASALKDPIAGFDALVQNAQISTKGTESYIAALIKVGREAEAAALIQQDLLSTYSSIDDARALASAQDQLGRSWAQLSQSLTSLIVPGLAEYISGVAASFQDLRNLNDPRAVSRLFTRNGKTSQIAGLLPGLRDLGVGRSLDDILVPKTAASPPSKTEQLSLQLQKQRTALFANEAKVISAQVQGYKELELVQRISNNQQQLRLDTGALILKQNQVSTAEEKAAIQVEIDSRRETALKERITLQEQLNELRRQNAVLERTSPAILQQSVALIDAQVNGSRRLQIIEQQRLSALESQRALELEGNRDPRARREIRDTEARRQAELAAQLGRLDKEASINARFRLPLLRNELQIIDAQVDGEERRALVLQRERNLRQAARALELEREPEARIDIRANATKQEAQDRAAILQFDKQRAATLREINFSSQQEQQNAARSLQFARQRATLADGPARQALEQRQAVLDEIQGARDRQAAAQFSLRQAEEQGGDAGRLRATELITKELPAAANNIQLALIRGATALRDASRELGNQANAAALNLARVRNDPQGLNQFISPFQQAARAQESFRQLQPALQQARRRFSQIAPGVTQPSLRQPFGAENQAAVDEISKFINAVNTEFDATESLLESTRALNQTNYDLINVNTQLAAAVSELAKKDWAVNVAVSSEGKATQTGDVLAGAAGAL